MAAFNVCRNFRRALTSAPTRLPSLASRHSHRNSPSLRSCSAADCVLGICARHFRSSATSVDGGRRYSPSSGYDGDGKTTVEIMNKESDYGLMVDSYSPIGFELNSGLMVLGPIALFPRSVLSWNVWAPTDINEETLSLFYMLTPKVDILVLGVGDHENLRLVQKDILVNMRGRSIGLEILPTHQAISTFNFLNAEGRSVAGAFIPPSKNTATVDDVFITMQKRRKLFIAKDED